MCDNSVALQAEKKQTTNNKQKRTHFFRHATLALKAQYWNALNNLS